MIRRFWRRFLLFEYRDEVILTVDVVTVRKVALKNRLFGKLQIAIITFVQLRRFLQYLLSD